MNNDDVNYRIQYSHYEVYNPTLDQMYGYSIQSMQFNSLMGLYNNITAMHAYANKYSRMMFYIPDESVFVDIIDKEDTKQVGNEIYHRFGKMSCYTKQCDYIASQESWDHFYAGTIGFKSMSKEDVRQKLDADMKDIRKSIRNNYKSKLTNRRVMNSDRKYLVDDIGYYYEEQPNDHIYTYSFIIESNTLTVLTYRSDRIEGLLKTVYSIPTTNKVNSLKDNYDKNKSTFEMREYCPQPTLLQYFYYVLFY